MIIVFSFPENIGGDMMSDLEQFNYETGTSIQTFNIIQTSVNEDGYEVLLNIDLDSGYELDGKMGEQKKEKNNKKEHKDFFNTTPSSE